MKRNFRKLLNKNIPHTHTHTHTERLHTYDRYVIVVGDAERSSLYDSGSGVLGAREKLGIVYAFVSKVIENGDSSLDLEEIQSNTEKWKGRCMASYSSIFALKGSTTCSQWTHINQDRSGATPCNRKLKGLSGSANDLSMFKVRRADDEEESGGGDEVRFVENDRGKGSSSSLRNRARKRTWETWGDVWGA